MFGLFNSAWTALALYLMRRRQFDNIKLRRYFREKHNIDVGLYSYGCFDRWRMPGPMRVGRYCSISSTTRSVLTNHPMDALTTHPAIYEKAFGVVDADRLSAEPLVIEDDVWIGHNVVILPGCKHVGRGAIVGAGSVVTKDVPSYTVVAGNPARAIRARFPPDLAAAVEASRWWEMDLIGLAELMQVSPESVLSPMVERMADLNLGTRR